MTGVKRYLVDIKSHGTILVIFSDDGKDEIKGVGKLIFNDLPRLDDVLLMKDVRSKDNCYLWVPQEITYYSTCLMSEEDEVKLWHQKLGHLNLKGMKRIISEKAIRGLPKLKIENGKVFGECQIGKQPKISHQKVQYLTTSKTLDFLNMDLMGTMQVESLNGKMYVFVVVDDFFQIYMGEFYQRKITYFCCL